MNTLTNVNTNRTTKTNSLDGFRRTALIACDTPRQMTRGDKFRERRELLGLSKTAFALKARVSRTALWQVENHESGNPTTIKKIEIALERLERDPSSHTTEARLWHESGKEAPSDVRAAPNTVPSAAAIYERLAQIADLIDNLMGDLEQLRRQPRAKGVGGRSDLGNAKAKHGNKAG